MGRGPKAQGIKQKTEPGPGLGFIQPERRKHLLLDCALMDTDRTTTDLRAIEHQIVGARTDRTGITLQ